jgi:CTP:molybdopterin cytidylyltransferase MocA
VKVVGLVLAAGASSRFGSQKLLAPLRGRPVLQHVLDTLADAGIADVAVVLGADAAAMEHALDWRAERRVINPRPQDGLSSSLRVGLDAAAQDPATEAVLITLGDQPELGRDVVRAVIEAARTTELPFVRARYADDDAPNPVLVRRAGWARTAGIAGDRGLGPLLAAHPELVAEVGVSGANPDVDTRDDLERLSGVS